MVYRPTSITVIAWLLVIMAVFSLFGAVHSVLRPNPNVHKALAASPLPPYLQHGLTIGSTIVHLLCGAFIFRGRNWARMLLVAWSVISLCVGLAVSPSEYVMAFGVAVFAVEVYFLFRPAANVFFADNGENIDPRSQMSYWRIAGIVFYILAGFLLACMGPATLMPDPALGIKIFVLGIFLVPCTICLAIGRWLAGGNWKFDIGCVCVLGGLAAGAMTLMMAYTASRPEFTQQMTPEKAEHFRAMFSDYTFAVIWLCVWVLLGVSLICLGLRKPERKQHPPIFGR